MITNKAEQKLQRRQWTGFACVLGAYAKKGGGERYSVTVTESVTSHSNGIPKGGAIGRKDKTVVMA